MINNYHDIDYNTFFLFNIINIDNIIDTFSNYYDDNNIIILLSSLLLLVLLIILS